MCTFSKAHVHKGVPVAQQAACTPASGRRPHHEGLCHTAVSLGVPANTPRIPSLDTDVLYGCMKQAVLRVMSLFAAQMDSHKMREVISKEYT